MTPVEAAAYVIAQSASMCAELGAMESANDAAKHDGQPPKFTEADFRAVPDRYCVHHNAVMSLFQEATR